MVNSAAPNSRPASLQAQIGQMLIKSKQQAYLRPDPAAGAELLTGLNDPQKAAVTHLGSPLLVVAGAGTGKTRVLTHRVAYLVKTRCAWPSQILAITFTNKAAAEMRSRLEGLLGEDAEKMWILTFHSACLRILRREASAAKLPDSFTIYDTDDQKRLLKKVAASLGLDLQKGPLKLKDVLNKISNYKNFLISPAEAAEQIGEDLSAKQLISIYTGYQEQLEAAGAIDFDDIIMKTVLLFQQHPEIAAHYRARFRYVLIDEYQDTNQAQYEFVRLLVGPDTAGLAVVGDADQSIYAFRGAQVRNIDEFEQDFPDAKIITLEQNYRSTQNILEAANSVIAHNSARRPKHLWTASGDGEKLVGFAAGSAEEEAQYVAGQIKSLLRAEQKAGKSCKYGDFAVFFRAVRLSRILEQEFKRANLPYRMVGGTSFFERREIKDAVAYLRIVDNPADTLSLLRIINVPKRGIGPKAIEAMQTYASAHGTTLGELFDKYLGDPGDFAASAATLPADFPLAGKKAQEVSTLWQKIRQARQMDKAGQKAGDVLDYLLRETGYYASLESGEIEDKNRIEALEEFCAVGRQEIDSSDWLLENWDNLDISAELEDLEQTDDLESAPGISAGSDPVASSVEAEISPLRSFLANASLKSTEETAEVDSDDQVFLMTVHAAKGLEFPYVFVVGMEEGNFPHELCQSEQEIEEERRLAYVAFTRAKREIFLTCASFRLSYDGSSKACANSRFLSEIPSEIITWTHSELSRTGINYSSADARGYGRFGRYSGDKYSHQQSASESRWNGGRTMYFDDAFLADDTGASEEFPSAIESRLASLRRRGRADSENNSQPQRLDQNAGAAAAGAKTAAVGARFAVGQRVVHTSFGPGVVVGREENGRGRAVVEVQFGANKKRLLESAGALSAAPE